MFTQNYADALKVIIPAPRSINLALIGCGGTGSWLAPAVARVGRWLMDMNHDVDIVFVDPDTVEEKNIFRQNFCAAEVGENKAETLAQRYSEAWGLSISAWNQKFQCDRWRGYDGFGVLLGCVDGPEGRKEINRYITTYSHAWWIDSGNTASYGQVLIGANRQQWEKKDPLSIPGYTSWVASPAVQHPELIAPGDNSPDQMASTGSTIDAELSCADMALRDSQGMAINQRMAAEMADYLIRLLITKDLRKYATYIDLETGSCQSKYITAEAISKWIK
ncbi:hypothetical protein hrd7_25140 [Leptolinea sp. HRD-7]|nr:hypothetical protein hrd7_25140 [Leptolinea sp. HRD-7]